MTKITGFSRKSKSKIIYPTCKSALRPVLHCLDIPVPSPPSGDVEPVLSDELSCSDKSEDTEIDPSFKDELKPLVSLTILFGIFICPKRWLKFWGLDSSNGIYYKNELQFLLFVSATKAFLLTMQLLTISATVQMQMD